MKLKRHYKYIVVGNGLISNFSIYWLNKFGIKDILNISDNNLYPPCTLNSTAIVSHFGTNTGHSIYGDLIRKSYNESKEFYSSLIEKKICEFATHKVFSKNENTYRRYNSFEGENIEFNKETNLFTFKSILVNPPRLLDFFSQRLSCVSLKGRLNKFDSKLKTINIENEDISFDFLILGTGIYQFSDIAQNFGKCAPGFYLEKKINFGNNSFIFSNENRNLVYRASNKIAQLNLYTGEDITFMSDFAKAKEEFLEIKKILKEYELGDINHWQLRVGQRHKGQKRLPIYKIIDETTVYISGLYKNGFTLGYYLTKDLIEKMVSESGIEPPTWRI